jgi:hypothetical protein
VYYLHNDTVAVYCLHNDTVAVYCLHNDTVAVYCLFIIMGCQCEGVQILPSSFVHYFHIIQGHAKIKIAIKELLYCKRYLMVWLYPGDDACFGARRIRCARYMHFLRECRAHDTHNICMTCAGFPHDSAACPSDVSILRASRTWDVGTRQVSAAHASEVSIASYRRSIIGQLLSRGYQQWRLKNSPEYIWIYSASLKGIPDFDPKYLKYKS